LRFDLIRGCGDPRVVFSRPFAVVGGVADPWLAYNYLDRVDRIREMQRGGKGRWWERELKRIGIFRSGLSRLGVSLGLDIWRHILLVQRFLQRAHGSRIRLLRDIGGDWGNNFGNRGMGKCIISNLDVQKTRR
jgi:hypothetical protein